MEMTSVVAGVAPRRCRWVHAALSLVQCQLHEMQKLYPKHIMEILTADATGQKWKPL